jgi:DNA sulfur modification protein DndD
MHLEKLTLTDWKLYGGEHTFDFPAPTRRKNVVLIGAKNGFGKTSFLEAIVFGLFGKEGVDLTARADSNGDEDRRLKSYRRFLEGAFNESAHASGRTVMRIELVLVDPESGERVQIRRTWTFRHDGRYHEEHVEFFVGGKAKTPGRTEV